MLRIFKPTPEKTIMKKIYIGTFAAFISAFSDVLLLYHPDLINKYENYLFLFEIDGVKNTWGWVLGMFLLPMLYLGYKGVKEIADERSKESLDKADWIVIFLISLGCVVHSVYHFLPMMHLTNPKVEEVEITTIKFIELLFVTCYIIFCTLISLQSLQKKNILLHNNRFFNPLFWMILVAVVFIITPKHGGYLAVSSFNMSIAFYFVGVLINRKKG